jgi:hypothetical protein
MSSQGYIKAVDPEQRLEELLDEWEPRLRLEFLAAISIIKDQVPVADIVTMVEQRRFDDLFNAVEQAISAFSVSSNAAFVSAGVDTAAFLGDLRVVIGFDQTNDRAVRIMRENQLRIVSGFTREQRRVVRGAISEGIRQGLNPRDQARLIQDSIGLTERQELAVQNFRRLLETGSRDALSRTLRDRRFDGTIERSLRTGEPLSAAQIDRMVGRYRERMLAHRAENIARTEALRSVHQGSEELYQQAIDQGLLQQEQLVRRWNTAGDARVRDSHGPMDGQKRPHGEPFRSAAGRLLRFPGDPAAPAEEIINCRCALSTRIEGL